MTNEIREATTPKQKQALHENVRKGVATPPVEAARIAESERLAKLGSAELASYIAQSGGADRYWAQPEPTQRWAGANELLGQELRKYAPFPGEKAVN